jgi:hypothetical protein
VKDDSWLILMEMAKNGLNGWRTVQRNRWAESAVFKRGTFAQLLTDAQAKIIHRSRPIKMRRARIASKADSIAPALAVFPARRGGAPFPLNFFTSYFHAAVCYFRDRHLSISSYYFLSTMKGSFKESLLDRCLASEM